MLLRALMFACVLLLLTGAAHAQTQTPAPWPPENPQDLFGPEVEIISVEEKTFAEDWNLPVKFDTERRIARLKDGRILPFPEDFEGKLFEEYETPTTIYLVEYMDAEKPVRYWMIDLETGEWVRLQGWPDYFETRCGTLPYSLNDTNYTTGWRIIIGRNSQEHACDLTTGYQTPPLPTGFSNWRAHDRDVSLYLSGVPDESHPEDVMLFAFDFETQTFIELGPFNREQSGLLDDFFFFSIFPNPRHILVHSSVIDYAGETDDYAFADVEQGILIQLPVPPDYQADRGRLAMRIRYGTEDKPHCIQRWLIPDTLLWGSYQVPMSCQSWEARSHQEDFYRVLNTNNTLAEVIAVNAWTGERRSFFTGEIEAMRWVSADGRYAAFELDSDGTISQQRWNPPLNAQLKLLDMATAQTLFELPAYDADGERFDFKEVVLNLLAIQGAAETFLVRLDGELSRVQAFPGTYRKQFGTEWLLLRTPDDHETPISESQATVVDLSNERGILLADTHTWPVDYRLADVSYRSEGVFTAMIEYTTSSEPIYMLYSLRVVGT